MPVVDSHCHVTTVWYEPVEVLLFQMERNAVDKAILIQINGEFNNDYQAECARKFPGRFASVVIVDTDRPDAPDLLAREAERGAAGVRLRPDTRSPGNDPFAIWRAADLLGLPVSVGGSGDLYAAPAFAELIAKFPKLKIVIEHLGSVNRPDGDEADVVRQKVFDLSRFPNTYIKLPGLGEFVKRAMPVEQPFPFVRPIPSSIDRAIAAFGANRVMWGSDYPPVSSREGYANALRFPMEQLAGRSEAERNAIFGDTALSVFQIR